MACLYTLAQLWPSLGMIRSGNLRKTPCVCGKFLGAKKPPISFLDNFVKGMKYLCDNCLSIDGEIYSIIICTIICDIPVMSFIKQTNLWLLWV